jgi:all-trans-retinol 13,14-reductase
MIKNMLITVFFICFSLTYIYSYYNQNHLPKKFNEHLIKKNVKHNGIKDIYRSSKLKDIKSLDSIIIGSGISGLTVAGLLAKNGHKVLVLEQHNMAGGCLHSFDDHGIEHETGIHYIGNIKKRSKILDLITDTPIEWDQLGENNHNIYDEIFIGNKSYKFRAGEQNFINDLSIQFPEERINIIKYISLVKKVSQKDMFFKLKIIQSKLLRKLCSYLIGSDYIKYTSMNTYDVISGITKNKELLAVLCGQFGDYGLPPKKSNFFIHASIVNHYLEGGYFPRGGTNIITQKICNFIENHGGKVLVGKKVENILIDKYNTAFGVRMENNDIIYAKNIISCVGINNTFKHLVKQPNPKYDIMTKKIGSSVSFIYLFVNLDGTPEELGLKSSNYWIYPHHDYDRLLEEFYEDYQNNPMPLFIACSCAKDSTWNKRYKNKSNAILLTMVKPEIFEQWEEQRCTKRDESYKDLKEIFAERMINEGLYKYYPNTQGKVLNHFVGTPLTNKFYLNSFHGDAYGLESNTYRYLHEENLIPKTDIKNLYLSGQDICTLGFTGALMSGILTTHSILGYGTLLDLITGRNLIDDFNNI